MRWLISFLAAGLAVIAQVTIVDRITFPGGTGPDLVLLAVAALALAGGPLLGSLIGFCAGLALDVAPPGSHYVGQDALVFCLIGYLCGLVAETPASEGVPEQGHTALFEIVVTAVGAACGEAVMALLGVMLSDPRVTWPAIKHVLPVAAGYDVVLAPFALYAAAAVLRLAGARAESRRAAFSGYPASGAITGAPRPAPMREPDLKLGNLRGQNTARKPRPKREPNLRLGRGGTLSGSALGAAFAGHGAGVAGALGSPARVRFSSRSPGGVLGGSLLGGSLGGSSLGGSSRLRSSRFGSTRMGRSLLGGSVFSQSRSALGRPAAQSRPSSPGRSGFLGRPLLGSSWIGRSPGRGRSSSPSPSSFTGRPSSRRRAGKLMRSSPGGSALGGAPRFSRGSALTRLFGAARPKPAVTRRSLGPSSLGGAGLGSSALGRPARRNLPGRGWLRRSAPYRSGLSSAGLSSGRLGRNTPRLRIRSAGSGSSSRLHMPRARMRKQKSWRKGGYR